MEPTSAESGVWSERLRIHSYDVDFRKRATAEAICRFFMEAAWNHAEQLGFGYLPLAKQNQLWVLSRLLVVIDRYPQWGELVELNTWPRGTSGVFALRDFEILGNDNRRLVAGTSNWLILDAATHRPQRIDKLSWHIPNLATRKATGREPGKLAAQPGDEAVLKAAVRYLDIDVNLHVNSARYVGWLLDSYTPEFHRKHALRSLEINYVGETLWSDTISVFSQQNSPGEFSHLILRADQSEVCRAQLQWTAEPADMLLSSSGAHT